MGALEIILLAGGAILSIVSFIMPEMGSELEQVDPQITKKQIKDMIDDQMKDVKTQVNDLVEETSQYSVEKTERALERITNEKISAVSEYSDTVMEDIHKSHEEVMFLYDMLSNKHEDLKDVASSVSASVKEARVTEEALSFASRKARESLRGSGSEDTEDHIKPDSDGDDGLKMQGFGQELDRSFEEAPAGGTEGQPASEPSDEEPNEGEVFHSETARDFFARHAKSHPTIDDIRASFQPMAFADLHVTGDEERVFGRPDALKDGEGEDAGDLVADDEEDTQAKEAEAALKEDDGGSADVLEAESDVGAAGVLETETDGGSAGVLEAGSDAGAKSGQDTAGREALLSDMDDTAMDAAIDELLGVTHSGLNTEADMDAALRALQGGEHKADTAAADAYASEENAKAPGTASPDGASANAIPQSDIRADDISGEGADASADINDVFGSLKESISAVVRENEASGKKAEAPEDNNGISVVDLGDEIAGIRTIEEKKKSPKKPAAKEKTKGRAKKTEAFGGDLRFRMDKEDGVNHNDRILKLHKKGKSNIAIARELGLGVGEVKLVLDLFNGR